MVDDITMPWWVRPNSTWTDLASAAAGGLSPGLLDESLGSTASSSSNLDIWMSATNDRMDCGHFTQVGEKLHFTKDVAATCQLWSEGIVSTGVAAFGLVGNMVSMWVLSAPEMRLNAFNRLLLALACIDCLFICPAILIYTFKAFSWQADWYNRLFPVLLYPCSEVALCSSIYMTVAIAVERYIGLCRPFRRLSSRPCAAKAYLLPVLALALLLNIPKFLETETVVDYDPVANRTSTHVDVTALRIHPAYITYYTMWTRLLATGIVPLAILAILNSKIYLAIRRSKAQLRSLAIRSALPMAILAKDLRIDAAPAATALACNGHHRFSVPAARTASCDTRQQQHHEPLQRSQSAANPPPSSDLNLAPVLFGVVIVFVLCNSLRVLLNIYDFTQVDAIIECDRRGVGRMPPAWILCSISVSHLLLMFNSSVNFLVYCVAGSKFRVVLFQKLLSCWKSHRMGQCCATTRKNSDQRVVVVRDNEAALLPDVAQRCIEEANLEDAKET